MLNKIAVTASLLLLALLLPGAPAQAIPVTFEVSIGTSDLSGVDAQLVFDLIDGDGGVGSSLTLSALDVVGGSLGATSVTGDASGNPATSAALGDTEFFNELVQNLTLGSSLSFTLDLTALSLPGTPVPDSFSLLLLDPTTGLTLVTTDLLGDALLTIDLAEPLLAIPAGLSAPTSPRLDVSATTVPEPSSALLLVTGLMGMLLARRQAKRRRRARVAVAATLALAVVLSDAASAQTAIPVDASVTTSIGGLVLDRATGNFVTQVRLTNHSTGTLGAPLSLAVTAFSRPGVTLANASGTDAQGPYVSAALPEEGMLPGAQIELRLAFANPSRARFTFTTSVRAVPIGSGIPISVRLQALDDLIAVDASAGGMSNADRLAALGRFVAGRPEFSTSGDDGTDFWATFTDGREVTVIENRKFPVGPAHAPKCPPTPPPTALRTASAPSAAGATASGATELPGSNQVRLLSSMGPNWEDVRTDVAGLLTERAYVPSIVGGSIEDMKHVGGEGVLYISGHGKAVPVRTGGKRFHLWTSTAVNPASEAAYAVDFSLRRLAYMIGAEDGNFLKVKTKHFAITSAFVEHYWTTFARNSLVYIDACDSATAGAADFQDAIFKKGATVYMGWSASVDDPFAAQTACLMFDRLLGTDRRDQQGFSSEDPPQRPFPWPDVLQDLPQHGLAADSSGTKLVALPCFDRAPKCPTEFGLLAPSIWLTSLFPDVQNGSPSDKMYINGVFGVDPGGAAVGSSQRAVSIDGREAQIDSWIPSLIVVQPAAKDNGSVGEVLVSVRDHESNRAMLSEWRGPFTTVARGPGSLKATIVHDLRFRADVRATRAQIHEPPDFTVGLGDMLGSRVRWECTGQDVVISGDTTSTTTWSGSQSSTEIPFDHTLPVSTNPGPSLTLFTLPGMEDATCISTLVVESPEKTETIESELQLLQFTAQNENLEILIGEDWQLLGQTRDPVTTGSGEVVQLSFPEIPNNFPPDPDQGR